MGSDAWGRASPGRYWKVQFTNVKLPLGDVCEGAFDELLLAVCEWRSLPTLGAPRSACSLQL